MVLGICCPFQACFLPNLRSLPSLSCGPAPLPNVSSTSTFGLGTKGTFLHHKKMARKENDTCHPNLRGPKQQILQCRQFSLPPNYPNYICIFFSIFFLVAQESRDLRGGGQQAAHPRSAADRHAGPDRFGTADALRRQPPRFASARALKYNNKERTARSIVLQLMCKVSDWSGSKQSCSPALYLSSIS